MGPAAGVLEGGIHPRWGAQADATATIGLPSPGGHPEVPSSEDPSAEAGSQFGQPGRPGGAAPAGQEALPLHVAATGWPGSLNIAGVRALMCSRMAADSWQGKHSLQRSRGRLQQCSPGQEASQEVQQMISFAGW